MGFGFRFTSGGTLPSSLHSPPRMLSSSRAFIVVCDGSFASDFDGPGPDCPAIHSVALDGSSGFYTFDTPSSIPLVMQLLGCSAIGGAVSGFPEGTGDTFSARYHGLKCALFSTDAPTLEAHRAYLEPRALLTQDAAAAAAAAVAADAHVVVLHLAQRCFPSQTRLLSFANDILSALPTAPEPLLGFAILSSEPLHSLQSVDSAADSSRPWKPLQSYMFHNAALVPHSCVRAAIAMRHSASVRRDLCRAFSLAAARDSGALCTTRACHFPRELSFDFGFLSKYGA
jgi:hypothetical protein